MMEECLRKHEVDISVSTKKHSRRNIEKTFKEDLRLLVVHERVYLYPKTLTLIDLVKERSSVHSKTIFS